MMGFEYYKSNKYIKMGNRYAHKECFDKLKEYNESNEIDVPEYEEIELEEFLRSRTLCSICTGSLNFPPPNNRR